MILDTSKLKFELNVLTDYAFYLCDMADKYMSSKYSMDVRERITKNVVDVSRVHAEISSVYPDIMSFDQFRRNEILKEIGI